MSEQDDSAPDGAGEPAPPLNEYARLWDQLLERRRWLLRQLECIWAGAKPPAAGPELPHDIRERLLAWAIDQGSMLSVAEVYTAVPFDARAWRESVEAQLAEIDQVGANVHPHRDRGPTFAELRRALGLRSTRRVPASHTAAAEAVKRWLACRDQCEECRDSRGSEQCNKCRDVHLKAALSLWEIEQPDSDTPVNLPAAWRAWEAHRVRENSDKGAAWIVRRVANPEVDHHAEWGRGHLDRSRYEDGPTDAG